MNALKEPWWRGQRGEWYVITQTALLLSIVLGPRSVAGMPPWPPHLISLSMFAGSVLLALGGLVSLFGVMQLGANLTPLPRPKDGAKLVVAGMYRFVRHPIYLGVILIAAGFALFVHGWLTLVEALILALFLDIKSRHEEVWLCQHFQEYEAYQRRVRKLIPFLY
jgi:protein-S-isoprenylcysteine O-methyltransferase Ste14